TDVTHKWLVLTFQLPARPTAARMRVWRQLQRLGALPVKGGAYLLPNTAQAREDFEWLRADIAARKGDAALFASDPGDPRPAPSPASSSAPPAAPTSPPCAVTPRAIAVMARPAAPPPAGPRVN